MRLRFRSTHGWITGCALLLIAAFGCTEKLTDPESPLFAKPAELDVVEVTATEPDSAIQDTTLFVDVLGDGFDDGSTVDFILDDTVATKLKALKVHYVNKKKLTVELEVAADAAALRYHVMVTTRRGPKGIGTELLRVIERVKDVEPFVVTDFQVLQVDHDLSPERCPLPTTPCNQLLLHFTGDADAVTFTVAHNTGLYNDATVENAKWAAFYHYRGSFEWLIPVGDSVVGYWQGQRRSEYWETLEGPPVPGDDEFIPDLGTRDAPDRFVFRYTVMVNGNYITSEKGLQYLPQNEAVYQGWTPTTFIYATFAEFEVGRIKKNQPAPLNFEVRPFTHPTTHDRSTTVHAVPTVLLTEPNGDRSILRFSSFGMDIPDPSSLYFARYQLQLDAPGCYELRVVGVDSYGGPMSFYDDRLAVWDPTRDLDGAAPVLVSFNGTAVTVGSCQ